MDFYRINEEYIRCLQKYEKEKEVSLKFLTFDIQLVINLHLVPLCR